MTTPSLQKSNRFLRVVNSQNTFFVLVVAVSVVLFFRLYQLVDQYAVNLFFSDQWAILNPLFRHQGLWNAFDYQHGPHRQGVGGLLIFVLANLTEWNARADSFACLALIGLALVAALALKWLLVRKWSLWDVFIPVIFLTYSQFETLTITPNEAHSAFPLLILVLYCLVWLIKNRPLRLALLVVVNFIGVFTGFAIFIGVITPIILIGELVVYIRQKEQRACLENGAALVGSIVSIAVFSIGYRFDPAVDCFSIQLRFLPKYPAYMAVIFDRFLGIDYGEYRWLAIAAGMILLVASLFVFLFHTWRLLHKGLDARHDLVISILSGFTLLFVANASIGRLCLAMPSAYSSRYVTLTIPALLAIILSVQEMSKPILARAAFIAILALSLVSLPVKSTDLDLINYIYSLKTSWKACYLQAKDVDTCNQESGGWIFPANNQEFQDKLTYLKENRLGLFNGD